jgi:hypothetical protein
MNVRSVVNLWILFVVGCGALITRAQAQSATNQNRVIYSTNFELSEGYDPRYTLVGQKGWLGFGSGGNGILTNFFEGFGQQAYIGFAAPAQKDDLFNIWRPFPTIVISSNQPIVKFSVMMQIADSSNGQYDDFRWSVYNTNDARLFSLDFDNSALLISYALDDDKGFVSTRRSYDNLGFYNLVITMNLARNLWSASLNDVPFVTSQPITTTGAALKIGDIDAVWAIRRPGLPGDNYMIFDNYRVETQAQPSVPPKIELVGFQQNGQPILRVFGETGLDYVIEATSDFVQWQPLKVLTAPAGGVFDYPDASPGRLRYRFYRAWHRQ